MIAKALPESAFIKKFKGRLFGVLQWSDLDALWLRVLDEPEGCTLSYRSSAL